MEDRNAARFFSSENRKAMLYDNKQACIAAHMQHGMEAVMLESRDAGKRAEK
jgi:hypothetical protein